MDYYIYKHTNKINGKCYIGQTKNIKWRWFPKNYFYCSKFYNAILKYGWENFTHEVIKICDETNVDYYERYYIKFYDSMKNGYNLETGGCKNKVQSEETIRKKIEANKKRVYKKGIIPWNKGLKASDEIKKKLSLAHKGKSRGSPSEETRKKISQAQIGKFVSEETRLKLSKSHIGHKSYRKKQIINIDTNEIFDSLTSAGKKYNINIKNISANLKKKSKSCGGYHWEYYNESIEPHLNDLKYSI